jgi:Ca-activated chloride channel family protein
MKPRRRIKVNNTEATTVFAPRDAASGHTIELAMQRLWLVGRILPVGARLLVRHTFRSGEKRPLEVIYSFGLPRDAALRRFRITGEGFSVSSDLKPIEKVRETYEEALADGHLAAMAAQYGDGLVNLTVGNIRPGEEVTVNLEVIAGVETRDDGLRFRFPFTLAPAYHARARAAEVAPGVGEIELPADEFGDLVLPQFVLDASALHEVGFDLSVSMGHSIVETGSPSHAVRVVGQGIGRSRVSLATAGDLPNRDLVLDIRTRESLEGVPAGTARDGRGYFGVVMPSSAFRAGAKDGEKEEPRRVVFLIDRSGSMQGAPIDQARKAVGACLGALGASDLFGFVAFDNVVETFGSGLAAASLENREKAHTFLGNIDARGGTELAAGIRAAVEMLREGGAGGGGDIMVVTDGQVMGTEAILADARAGGIRLHCLGIGSASQDRFLALLARETGGVSRFLTPCERVDLGAVELFASIGRPLGSGLEAKVEGFKEGRVDPDPPAFVFGGTPVVVFGDTAGAGEGRLALTWDAGGEKRTLAVPLRISACGDGDTLRLLQGARLITDFESRYPAGGEGAIKGREAERVKKRLVALSQAYGLASREMGLVAVVERAGDRPGDIPVTRVVPVGLAQDVAMGAYFAEEVMLRSFASINIGYDKMMPIAHGVPLLERAFRRKGAGVPGPTVGVFVERGATAIPASSDTGDAKDVELLHLASSLEPDGGMPGKSEELRALATILTLLRFLADGHSVNAGAFRAHVKRMVGFLEAWLKRPAELTGKRAERSGKPAKGPEQEEAKLRADVVKEAIERGRSGRALPGDWSHRKPEPALWAALSEAFHKAKAPY